MNSSEPDTLQPVFSYSDIKFAESKATFGRAVALFAGGKVTDFCEIGDGYQAIVIGTQPYRVRVNYKRVDYADCDCYLGQNDSLCKHMLALALAALHKYGMIDDKGKPTATTRLKTKDAKLHITAALRKIGSYNGPSRIWFEYQRKLDVAAGMIIEAVPLLETNLDNAKYLWKLVLKLSKKLSCGGVDDSNGTIGDAVMAIIDRIAHMAKNDDAIRHWAVNHCGEDTGFGFEENLQRML